MKPVSYYYLNEHGQILFASNRGKTIGARMVWAFYPELKASAWRILVEGTAAGADKECVNRLAEKWKCTGEDAMVYANMIGFRLESHPTPHGERWLAMTLGQSEVHSSLDYIEAMAAYALALGFSTGRRDCESFQELVNKTRKEGI